MLNDTVNEHVYTVNKRVSISEKTGDLNHRPKELRSEIMNLTLPRHRRKNNRRKDNITDMKVFHSLSNTIVVIMDGSVAEWLACWTQAQKGPGSNRSRDAVG